MKLTRLIIGLMSGTSVDGIDAALVRVRTVARGKYSAKVLAHVEVAWPAEIRRRLLAVMAPAATTTQEICELNVRVAEGFAAAAVKVMRAAGVLAREVAAIGSHGQTICHLPVAGGSGRGAKGRVLRASGSTLQIGDVSVIAQLTGIRTVGNFRTADMAAGGQGAPLVPFADAMLLSDARRARAVQNIGGIANVTYLPAGASGRGSAAGGQHVIAFDTGPGNMLIDALVSLATRGRERFDREGQMARQGALDRELLARLKGHPYFSRQPPKSTGREDFGLRLAEKLHHGATRIRNRKSKIENLIHTATRLTAWSIADAYRRFLPRMPEEVILCGGGADNPVLVRMLAEELAAAGGATALRRMDEFGIPNKAKEAASFAILAAATLDGVAGNLPSVTGARRGVVLGQVADAVVKGAAKSWPTSA